MTPEPVVTHIADALAQLGASAALLSESEKRHLDERGYLVLERQIAPPELAALRDAYERLMQQSAVVQPHGREAGARRLFDLENQGPLFDAVWTLPKMLAAVAHILGRDFRFVTLNGRDAVPGEGHQALHRDWGNTPGGPFNAVTCLVMLDGFTPDNGATRVVPGTHRLAAAPPHETASAPHPEEILLTAPAGSVGVFNSHVWHGGTLNRTTGTRRALHPFFMARDQPQSGGHLDARDYIRVRTWKRLSPAARYLMNVNWDAL